MSENIPTKVKNDLVHSQKPIRALEQNGKEIERIEYGKSSRYETGKYYKFTTDVENEPTGAYFEINAGGDISFSRQSLLEWRKIKIKRKKKKDTNDETVNVTIGEDRPDI